MEYNKILEMIYDGIVRFPHNNL